MAVSKNRKNHKQKLNNFKTNQRHMSNQAAQQLAEIRTVPVWNPEANILIKGFEWEAIQNGLGSLQMSMQAAQSVMSRNIVEGNIQMDFEKLDPQTLQYVPMTEDEKTPHREAFAQQVIAFKEAQLSTQNTPKNESVIVTEDNPVSNESGLVKPNGEALTSENVNQPAKIITMGSNTATSSE